MCYELDEMYWKARQAEEVRRKKTADESTKDKPSVPAQLAALGDHVHLQAVGHRDDRARDGNVVLGMRQVAHEAPVHLEVVDRKELEVAERRIAGAEVVDGEVHPHRAQIAHELHRLVRIPHHHAFGDFELEDAGFGPGGLEDFRELGYELLLAELDG